MTKKTPAVLILALLILTVLIACGGTDEASPSSNPSDGGSIQTTPTLPDAVAPEPPAPPIAEAGSPQNEATNHAPTIDGEIIFRDSEITILRAPLPSHFDHVTAFSPEGVAEAIILADDAMQHAPHARGRWHLGYNMQWGFRLPEWNVNNISYERVFIDKFGQPVDVSANDVEPLRSTLRNPQGLQRGGELQGLNIVGSSSILTADSGVVDAAGNVIVPAIYGRVDFVNNFIIANRVIAAENRTHAYIYNADGNLLNSGAWGFVLGGREGMLSFYVAGDTWGFLDSNAQVVVAPEYALVNDFNNGLATVYRNGQWYVLEILRQGGTPVAPSTGGATLLPAEPDLPTAPLTEAVPGQPSGVSENGTPIITSGMRVVFEADGNPSNAGMEEMIEILRRRLDSGGFGDPSISHVYRYGHRQIVAEFATTVDIWDVMSLLDAHIAGETPPYEMFVISMEDFVAE